jgi:hypothetical protein
VHDLFPELGELLEGGERGDAEDEEEALSFSHVQFSIVDTVRRRRSRKVCSTLYLIETAEGVSME